MQYTKEIVYHHDANPSKRCFQMWLDGEHVGDARSYLEAEESLDELIATLASREYAALTEQPAA